MAANSAPPNLDLLLRLRLVIARLGEMDCAGWWNTRGLLGTNGTFVFRRSFPNTHFFAQARVAFAVARSRCQEVFAPPNCATLWNLPAEIEERFPRYYPLGLGVLAVSPLEMVRAFATFPNQGREVVPVAIRYIEDRNGKIILEPVDSPHLTLLVGKGRSQERFDEQLPLPDNVHLPMVQDFVDAVLAGRAPVEQGAEGEKVNRILAAIDESARIDSSMVNARRP